MSTEAFELARQNTAQHSAEQHSTAHACLASYSKQAYPRRGYLGGLPGKALERHLARWHSLLHQPMSAHLLLHPLHVTTQTCLNTASSVLGAADKLLTRVRL